MSDKPKSASDIFRDAHKASDTDFDRTSLHHTLGKGATQAAPGNHEHAGSVHDHDLDYADIVHTHAQGDVTGLVAALAAKMDDGEAAGGDLTGTYPNPTIGALKVTDAKVAAANKDGAAATPSMRTLGTGATQAAAGNHTHAFPNHDSYEVACSASVTVALATDVDITGLTQSVTVGGVNDVYLVTISADIAKAAATFADNCQVSLNVAGANRLGIIIVRHMSTNARGVFSKTWKVTGLAAGATTFKGVVKLSTAVAASYTVGLTHTTMVIEKIAAH